MSEKKKMGKPRKLMPFEEIGVYNMSKKGCSQVEIAVAYKISVSTVNRIIRELRDEPSKEQQHED